MTGPTATGPTAIGWIDGEPVPRRLLDARLAVLRAGPLAAALPAPGSREGRQLVRWTAHSLLTELLCAREAEQRGLDLSAPTTELDALGAVQLGSITAMAWRSHPAVSAVFGATVGATVDRRPRPPETPTGPRRRISLATGPTPDAARAAPWTSIGWSTLGDLPEELADAARHAPVGEWVGPLRSRGGWHLLRVDELVDELIPGSAGGSDTPAASHPPSGTELRAFARWLDLRRAQCVRVAPGFEHPGDPSQPDHTHQH